MNENYDAKGAEIINADQIETLRNVADEVGGKLREYSGRGMYGAYCAGISCPNYIDCIEVAAEHGITGARYDQLGLKYIVYWPNIKYEGKKVMNGEELYEFYGVLQLLRNNCAIDAWDDADAAEQRVWNDMADLLCPEMSDDAKELKEQG